MDGRPLGQFVLCKLSEAKTVPQSSLPSMVPRDSWPGERPPMTQGWGSWEKMQIPVCPVGSSLFSLSSIYIQIFFPNASPADLKWLQDGPRLRGSRHKPPRHPYAKSFFANQPSVAVWLPGAPSEQFRSFLGALMKSGLPSRIPQSSIVLASNDDVPSWETHPTSHSWSRGCSLDLPALNIHVPFRCHAFFFFFLGS